MCKIYEDYKFNKFIKKILNYEDKKLIKKFVKKIDIFTYHFPDGKWYIGYTTSDDLTDINKVHKNTYLNIICNYVRKYPDILPRLEKTYMGVNEYFTYDEKNKNLICKTHPQIYEYEKEIIKKLGIKPEDLLNDDIKYLYN